MKKLIATLFIGGLILSMSACGNKADTEVANVTETVETTAEAPTPEPTEAPTPEPTAEPTPEPTEEPVEEFTTDEAMEKVANLFNARNDLLLNGSYEIEHSFLVALETLQYGFEDNCNLTTSDGISLDITAEGGSLREATTANYFYNYVNNNSGYYEFSDYVVSHTKDEIFEIWGGNGYGDTELFIMQEAPGVIEYLLSNVDNLYFDEMIVGENCSVESISGVEVYYELPLTISSERCGVTAAFDERGNLLNLITVDEDGWSDDYYADSVDEILSLKK